LSPSDAQANLVEIDVEKPVWDQFFTVAPLVLIGTNDEEGGFDLAPKHMVTPMGWQNYFGFVCSPSHTTCRNITSRKTFTVSYPKSSQLVHSSLAASPRSTQGDKPVLELFETFPASQIEGSFIKDAYLFFECRHFKTVTGFGENCLITGEIVAAYVDRKFHRVSEYDDQELIHESPLFAYLSPGRFATIEKSNSFPFPLGMKK